MERIINKKPSQFLRSIKSSLPINVVVIVIVIVIIVIVIVIVVIIIF